MQLNKAMKDGSEHCGKHNVWQKEQPTTSCLNVATAFKLMFWLQVVSYIHLWFTADTFTTCMCVVCTCVFYVVPLVLQHLHHCKQVVLTTEYVVLMVTENLNLGHRLLLHYTVIIATSRSLNTERVICCHPGDGKVP